MDVNFSFHFLWLFFSAWVDLSLILYINLEYLGMKKSKSMFGSVTCFQLSLSFWNFSTVASLMIYLDVNSTLNIYHIFILHQKYFIMFWYCSTSYRLVLGNFECSLLSKLWFKNICTIINPKTPCLHFDHAFFILQCWRRIGCQWRVHG